MKRAKKTKLRQRRTELDRIVTQLRTMLRRDTTSVIETGKLLLRSRELHADQHGEWQAWLAVNFDLGYRTALNYMAAAEYVARKGRSETVSHFANLSPTVLYHLAEGRYTEQAETEILAKAKAGKRIDQDRASAICEALAPPEDYGADDGDDQNDGGEDGSEEEDPEIAAILDGPPPDVPPPAPNPPPTDFALQDFEQAISALKRLMTKPSAQFAPTIHTVSDLENVEAFIHSVMQAKARAAAA